MLVLIEIRGVWVNLLELIPGFQLQFRVWLAHRELFEGVVEVVLKLAYSDGEFFGIVMVIIVPVLDVPLNLIKLMLIIINDSCIRKLQTI